MDALEELDEQSVPVAMACRALGASRATLYRRTSPPRPPAPRLARPPRRLAPAEETEVLRVLHEPDNVDRSVREVFARLFSAGLYLASVSTMYRLLTHRSATKERRRGHITRTHVMPQLVATAPNQVWTWDITKVPGVERGEFFYVYVVLDMFSRFVVGWLASERENAALATHLIRETANRRGIEPKTLTLHSDRGSPMTAGTMTQLLANLGIEQSVSRPRVSNDNPFVESHFKTAKYRPDYPERFTSVLHVRGHFEQTFAWYNDEHHHDGLALFTPADVYFGRVNAIADKRQAALDEAFRAHPERFVRGRPLVRRPPARVHINLPPDEATPKGSDVNGAAPKAPDVHVEHRAADPVQARPSLPAARSMADANTS